MDIGKEIIGDIGDRNIINIQFVPLDKKQQKVERAFELGQLYLVRVGQRIFLLLIKLKMMAILQK